MEHYIFGALYGVMSIIFIMSYIVVVYLIATTKSLRSKSYNLIVLHLTLADLLQLIFNGISSTCFLFWPAVYESHHLVNKICGALALTGWFLYCTLANLLAFNSRTLCKTFLHPPGIVGHGLQSATRYSLPDGTVGYAAHNGNQKHAFRWIRYERIPW
uniref:7TM GPCR serpentine receptor class x (Srx) domain-containing protein n=1 Tax=Romanomermis culicivorax TaxID=13658 RepID=A0A915JQP2_ROMCU